MKTHRAFTLTEIMIAITIVAVMATLGIPALKKARMSSHLSQYIADRRVIEQAIIAYRAETGQDLTQYGVQYLDLKLHPYLPLQWRKTENFSVKGPFGGCWYTWSSGQGVANTTAQVTLHLPAATRTATAPEIIELLRTANKLDDQTQAIGDDYVIYSL